MTEFHDASAVARCVPPAFQELQEASQEGVSLNVESAMQAHSFEVEEDSSSYTPYERGGLATQHKEPKVLSFRTLAEAINDPGEFLLSDFSKIERSALLHIGFQALEEFQVFSTSSSLLADQPWTLPNTALADCLLRILMCAQETRGRLPKPRNLEDAKALVELAESVKQRTHSSAELEKQVLHELAFTSAGDLSPMSALFGGIVGQEAIKAVSGKFHPLHQWLYFDCAEALPDEPLTEEDCAPQVNVAP